MQLILIEKLSISAIEFPTISSETKAREAKWHRRSDLNERIQLMEEQFLRQTKVKSYDLLIYTTYEWIWFACTLCTRLIVKFVSLLYEPLHWSLFRSLTPFLSMTMVSRILRDSNGWTVFEHLARLLIEANPWTLKWSHLTLLLDHRQGFHAHQRLKYRRVWVRFCARPRDVIDHMQRSWPHSAIQPTRPNECVRVN